MIDRRVFLRGAGATLVAASGLSPLRGKSPRVPVVFDAMGEIREVYDRELVGEIIDSGLNAITVTLCDPKTFEEAAMEAAMEGIIWLARSQNPDGSVFQVHGERRSSRMRLVGSVKALKASDATAQSARLFALFSRDFAPNYLSAMRFLETTMLSSKLRRKERLSRLAVPTTER